MNYNKICVIGLGYIGLPTASTFAMNGVDVLGVDISPTIIETLNRGEIHIHEPGLPDIFANAVKSGKFKAALKPEEADAFIIAVPTPFKENETGSYNGVTYKLADMRAVTAAAEAIVPFLRKGNVVVLESTSPPRTTFDL
ncbi:MAG: NAD(P)-binding domain-containing protein, partial [Chloroflexota bacterium]